MNRLFLLAVSIAMWCASAGAAPLPPDIIKVVSFIFLADEDGKLARDPANNPRPYGTGFFVGIKVGDGSRMSAYLVTAKHVLKDKEGHDLKKAYVRVNAKNGDPQFALMELFDNNISRVYTHPDPTVDIAVVPVSPDETILDFKVIPEEMLTTKASFDDLKISEGSDIFFVGLFANFYGEHKNFPIARFGRVAMVPGEKIPWKDGNNPVQNADLYLLETQTYGGNSGAPVFFYLGMDRTPGQLMLGTEIRLAGVMRGYFNNNDLVKFLQSPTAAIPYYSQNIGIAAVTPSYLLHEILYSEPLVKLRAKLAGSLESAKKPLEPAPAPITPSEPAK
jgi:hypothetical protein